MHRAHSIEARVASSGTHLTYTGPSGNWSVQAFARNLENRNTMTGYQSSGPINAVYLAEPRVFGVRGSVTF